MRIFKEEQRFTQPILIILISMSTFVFLGIILNEYYSEGSSMTTTELIVIIGFYLLCILPLFFFRLITRIDEKGIHYRFFPFHGSVRTIAWSEIKSATVRKYDAISEYGGWGLRGGFRRKRGKAINVSGDIGIQLELTNTKKLLIGTKKEAEAKKVLETYSLKLNNSHE